MVIKQIPEDTAALCKAHANRQTWDTDQLVCSWIVHSMLSVRQFYFYVLWAVVRANWVPLWLKMLRKLRQMAQIQTRVIQGGERGLALQSGVTEGHRPAPHLLVFSKAHVQQLCSSPLIPAIRLPPHKMCRTWSMGERWRQGRGCMQNEVAGLTEVHCAFGSFSADCSTKRLVFLLIPCN